MDKQFVAQKLFSASRVLILKRVKNIYDTISLIFSEINKIYFEKF